MAKNDTEKRSKSDEIMKLRNEMVGNRYKHNEGDVYIVTDIALHPNTGEIMVVYKDFCDLDIVLCLPIDTFRFLTRRYH